jgi:hypothetical protein
MTKIVYNACYGGFSISEQALMRYAEIKGLTLYPEDKPIMSGFTYVHRTYWLVPPDQRGGILPDEDFTSATLDARKASNEAYGKKSIGLRDFERSDPVLIQVVEELGDAASGDFAKLKIAEVDAGQRYRIDEYDGNESVMTVEDYGWKVA